MSSQDGGVTAMLREHRIDNCEVALAEYIARQRWAGAQGRTIATTAIVDAAVIRESSPVLLHTLTAVTFTDGGTTRYALPLGIRPVGDPIAERVPEFMIPWAQAPSPIVLYDAVGDFDVHRMAAQRDSRPARAAHDQRDFAFLVP